MDSVEIEANSIDEAIDSALKTLGTTRDRVDVEIMSNVARGFFGLGGRKAKIRATLRKPLDATPAASLSSGAWPKAGPAAPERREKIRPVQADVGLSGRGAERARQVLQDVVDRVGVSATAATREEDDRILLDLSGDASGLLIGRRGQMLDALEYIVNRIVSRDEGGSARIIVDSEGYRERRRQSLEELARRMGERAKQKSKPVTLNPMSPRDRRIVHLVFQDDPTITTRSAGTGYFRKIVIVPASEGRSTSKNP